MKKLFLTCLVGVALATFPTTSRAETERIVIRADALPSSSAPTAIDPARASLPGVREGGKIPAWWRDLAGSSRRSRCVDSRQGHVESSYGTSDPTWVTRKITEVGGRMVLDEATVAAEDDVVRVREAKRTPVVEIFRSRSGARVYAYRNALVITLLVAADWGERFRIGGYGCEMTDRTLRMDGGVLTLESSVTTANATRQALDGVLKTKSVPISGLDFVLEASVSRSSSDPSPLLSLVFRSSRSGGPQ